MEKITEEQFKSGNRKIAEFMDYIYYHKGVDIDYSDCGGCYEKYEVFSKTPILVDEYEDSTQCYFSDVPNPDYKNKNNPQWNPDIEFLDWSNLNEFKTELSYHTDLNQLQEVVNKIKDMKYPISTYQSHIQNSVHIYELDSDHYIVRESSTILKPIELLWLAIVNFIKIYNKKNAQ